MPSFISSFMEAVEGGLAFDPDGDKTVERDKRLGYGITKDPNTKRYFSSEDPDLIKAPHPSRLQMLKGKLEEDK